MRALTIIATVALAGCAVGPDYARPEIPLQTRFAQGSAEAVGAVAQQAWWNDYGDARLSALIARGMGQSLDIMAANERIRQAQANLRTTGDNAAISGGIEAADTRTINGSATAQSSSADLGANFVIDLFGGIKRDRQSAEAAATAARAEVETVRLAWLAELVAAYSDARYYQQVLALTRETITARKQTVEITRVQFQAGAATEYEVAEAEALLSTARAALPQYAALFDANVYAIATLMNEPAGPLLAQLQRGAPPLRTPSGGGTGVPADLLRNRPDLRSAEADLAKAVADVGVAEAALYPSLTLTGNVGFSSASNSWSFGPAISLPVLNQGALRAARNVKISLAKQAEITWRASVVAAVEDVQVAQSNYNRYRQRASALDKAASDYRRAFRLAQDNYKSGATTLLDLLATDRNTAAARISAASAQNDAAKAFASLKIAIGAGAGAAAPGT